MVRNAQEAELKAWLKAHEQAHLTMSERRAISRLARSVRSVTRKHFRDLEAALAEEKRAETEQRLDAIKWGRS